MVNDPLCPECNDTHQVEHIFLEAVNESDRDVSEWVRCESCPTCERCGEYAAGEPAPLHARVGIKDFYFCADDDCLLDWVGVNAYFNRLDLEAETALRVVMQVLEHNLAHGYPHVARDAYLDCEIIEILIRAAHRFQGDAGARVTMDINAKHGEVG